MKICHIWVKTEFLEISDKRKSLTSSSMPCRPDRRTIGWDCAGPRPLQETARMDRQLNNRNMKVSNQCSYAAVDKNIFVALWGHSDLEYTHRPWYSPPGQQTVVTDECPTWHHSPSPHSPPSSVHWGRTDSSPIARGQGSFHSEWEGSEQFDNLKNINLEKITCILRVIDRPTLSWRTIIVAP